MGKMAGKGKELNFTYLTEFSQYLLRSFEGQFRSAQFLEELVQHP